MSDKDELGNRQRRFCCLYAALGDPEEAAVRAGFHREEALGAALRLLKSRACRRRIKEHRELLGDGGSVMAGLRRLAFGSCNDAVKLAFADELPPQEELDRRFLYEPQRALEFRDKMAMRGWKRSFFTYRGYRGEDLFDRAQVGEVTRDITSVRINGGRNGIITEIGMYSDKFVEPQ